MKLLQKKGFTLIELLVVITIIGILATAGIGIFTTQLQKARDSSRNTDIKMYETALTQHFSDKNEYPATTGSGFTGYVLPYVSVLKQDVKAGVANCRAADNTAMACDYNYAVGDDQSGIPRQSYKLAYAMENLDNVKNLAVNTKDGSVWEKTGPGADKGASWVEVFGGNQGAALAATGSTNNTTNADNSNFVNTAGSFARAVIRK